LIWFAGGAATAGLATFTAEYLRKEPVTTTAFLIFEEPVNVDGDGKVSDLETIADQTGEMLRHCEASSFETTALYTDHLPTADLPIKTANSAAFACALNEGAKRGYRMNIELRTDRNAQTH